MPELISGGGVGIRMSCVENFLKIKKRGGGTSIRDQRVLMKDSFPDGFHAKPVILGNSLGQLNTLRSIAVSCFKPYLDGDTRIQANKRSLKLFTSES